MFKPSIRIGHVHITKTGGTAANTAIFSALKLPPFHVLSVVDELNASADMRHQSSRVIVRKTLSEVLAKQVPFLPAHISYNSLRELDRDFIFSVIRDPKDRLFSLYTYFKKRAVSPKVIARHPALAQYSETDLVSFLTKLEVEGGGNGIAKALMGDTKIYMRFRRNNPAPTKKAIARLKLIAKEGLSRFDVIYAPIDVQEVISDLSGRELIPGVTVERLNESKVNTEIGIVNDWGKLEGQVERLTWHDDVVCEVVGELFPAHYSMRVKSMEEFISIVKSKVK